MARVPKAVPIVVGAGLAVGTFCGLLFGVGLRKVEPAQAAPAPAPEVVETIDAAVVMIDAPAELRATVRFAIDPPDAEASITVDGQPVSDREVALNIGDGERTIKVVAKADGYRTFEKKVVVTDDQTIEITLKKRSSSSSSSSPRPDEDKPKGTPGNLIDL